MFNRPRLVERFGLPLAATGTLALTLGFFAPLNIYTQNITEFVQRFVSVAVSTVLVTIAFWLVLLIGLFLALFVCKLIFNFVSVNRLINIFSVSLVTFTGVVWLQGNLLALNFIIFDGRPINWDQYRIPIILNLITWLGLIITSVRFYKSLSQIVWPLIIVLLVMQSSNLFWEYLHLPPLASYKTHSIDKGSLAQFSPNQNILLIVLDSFQSDVFEELILNEPQLKNDFNGFTYYNNISGTYPTTYPSIPLILTGQTYLNQIPIQDFLRNAYLSVSLPKKLQDLGYSVQIPCDETVYCDSQVSSAFMPKEALSPLTKPEIVAYYKPTFVRYFPEIAYELYQKTQITRYLITNPGPITPDYSRSLYAKDQASLREILVGISANAPVPTFKYFHFNAAHPPFDQNTAGQYQIQSHDRQGQINHSLGSLHYALDIINRLKSLEVYNQSLIIVMSDHGYGPLGYKSLTGNNPGQVIQNQVIASALPLLLVKPPNGAGGFKINQTPISYLTFTQDILTYLDRYRADPSTPFSLTKSSVRQYYYYTWEGHWNDLYLPVMTGYQIDGPVRAESSWSKTGMIYQSPSREL